MELKKGELTKIHDTEEVYLKVSKSTNNRIDLTTNNKNLRFILYLSESGWELSTHICIPRDATKEDEERIIKEVESGIRCTE